MTPVADDWLAALQALRARGRALRAGDARRGRRLGAARARHQDGRHAARPIAGSIGGGHLEHKATEHARQMLVAGAERRGWRRSISARISASAAAARSACCSSRSRPADFAIAHLRRRPCRQGAGRRARRPAERRILWIDARAEQFPAEIPAGVERIVTDAAEDEVKDLPPGCFALIMTHSHDLDLALVRAAAEARRLPLCRPDRLGDQVEALRGAAAAQGIFARAGRLDPLPDRHRRHRRQASARDRHRRRGGAAAAARQDSPATRQPARRRRNRPDRRDVHCPSFLPARALPAPGWRPRSPGRWRAGPSWSTCPTRARRILRRRRAAAGSASCVAFAAGLVGAAEQSDALPDRAGPDRASRPARS